jgi:hypothetical protein
MRIACRSSVRKPERKRPLTNLCVDGRIILKLILKEYYMRVWIGLL